MDPEFGRGSALAEKIEDKKGSSNSNCSPYQ